MEQQTCKNCGTSYSGKYCNNCRQPADTYRISWMELAHHLPHALFHADKGLLYTFRNLTLNPGNSIRDYIQGKRVYHFNPLLYLILMGGLTTFLYNLLHIDPPNSEIDLNKIEGINSTLSHKYFAVVGLIFILLLTITDYLFYFNKKYLMPELVVSNFFQAGQIMVFTLLVIPLFLFQSWLSGHYDVNVDFHLPFKIFCAAFLFFVRYQFYQAKGNYLFIFKIIIQLILVSVLYNVVITKFISDLIK
ncbi:MAG TPA: DUF3667 domain-containing protein [Bacteroidia bacterium]|nr:DUF3667 domain-containing protein [Bacteroidia bacterium]